MKNRKKSKVLHVYCVEGILGDAIRIKEIKKWLSINFNYNSLNLAYNLSKKINTKFAK